MYLERIPGETIYLLDFFRPTDYTVATEGAYIRKVTGSTTEIPLRAKRCPSPDILCASFSSHLP